MPWWIHSLSYYYVHIRKLFPKQWSRNDLLCVILLLHQISLLYKKENLLKSPSCLQHLSHRQRNDSGNWADNKGWSSPSYIQASPVPLWSHRSDWFLICYSSFIFPPENLSFCFFWLIFYQTLPENQCISFSIVRPPKQFQCFLFHTKIKSLRNCPFFLPLTNNSDWIKQNR